jgi:lactoylglutathione lyase
VYADRAAAFSDRAVESFAVLGETVGFAFAAVQGRRLLVRDTVLELTYNWDQEEPYDLGDGFGHIAIGMPDIYGVCEKLEAEGVSIPRPPGPMKHGGPEIAFIEDPDGYKIELIQRSD